jgi:hypothetical protein
VFSRWIQSVAEFYVPADQANKIAGLFWTEHILLSLSILVCDVLYRPVRHCSPRLYFSITRLLFLNATETATAAAASKAASVSAACCRGRAGRRTWWSPEGRPPLCRPVARRCSRGGILSKYFNQLEHSVQNIKQAAIFCKVIYIALLSIFTLSYLTTIIRLNGSMEESFDCLERMP